jgi:hypothetical protein
MVALIVLVMWRLWYMEEHDPTEDEMINNMVKRDKKAQKKRGDIIKEVRTRGY